MRASFDQVDNMDNMDDVEEADEPGHGSYRRLSAQPAEPRDLTLGMTALLGIFFAVVLVCAVFFGFGYSTGRTLHGTKMPVASAPVAKPTAASSPEAGSEATSSLATPYTTPPPVSKPSPYAAVTSQAGPAPARPAASEQTVTRASYTPAATTGTSPNVAASSDVGGMVQIAAVMHQGDAQALAQALRRNGYPAVVRTEPQDNFLHVQVGPFATREQARAMRARLQADGYNPIMKP